MNIKPLPSPIELAHALHRATMRRERSEHVTELLRTLLRFPDWTQPPHSRVAPRDVLATLHDALRHVRLGRDLHRTIRRVLHRYSVTVTVTTRDSIAIFQLAVHADAH